MALDHDKTTKRQNGSVNEAIVIAVAQGGRTTKAAAQRFGISQRWVRALVCRARLEGTKAVKRETARPPPTIEQEGQTWRTRHDKVSTAGTVTCRWAGQLKHLVIGRAHAGAPVLILAANQTMIINRQTGEIIAEHTINPNKDYQPKKRWHPPRQEEEQ